MTIAAAKIESRTLTPEAFGRLSVRWGKLLPCPTVFLQTTGGPGWSGRCRQPLNTEMTNSTRNTQKRA